MSDDTPRTSEETPPATSRSAAAPAPPEGEIRVVDRRWWARTDRSDGGDEDVPTSDKPTYVQELEQRLAQKDDELRATIARYREAAAEFEHARARFRREVGREAERSRRAILADLLDVIDNLDRAIDAARQADPGGALLTGVDMVRTQFLGKLEGQGVRRFDAEGQRFDPTLHEAVTTVPVSDPARDGVIVGVVRNGYLVGDEVLRPAIVAVARIDAEGAGT